MQRIVWATVLVLLGCRSSLELDAGRAYECSRDAGVNGCLAGWVCGTDNRCFDPAVGLTRPCAMASVDCGGGWRCGLDNQCFDPTVASTRTCADPVLHCPTNWKCGVDRICFDPAGAAGADGGARACADALAHCAAGQRCGADGQCFVPSRSIDAGAGPDCRSDDQCAIGWRCGAEDSTRRRRCQPVGVGGPWFCNDDSNCEGWRCNPIEQVCVDVREPIEGPRFTAVDQLRLSGDDGGSPTDVAASTMGRVNIPGLTQADFVTFATIEGSSLVITLWTDSDPRGPDGGTIRMLRRTFPIDPARVKDLAAIPDRVLMLLDSGELRQYRHADTQPTTVTTGVLALRQSLNTAEAAALKQDPSGYRIERIGEGLFAPTDVTVQDICGPDAGAIVDFSYAVEPGSSGPAPSVAIRSAWLTQHGLCFHSDAPTLARSPTWVLPASDRPRRLHLPFHQGPGAFVVGSRPERESALTNLVIEFSTADGGQSLLSVLMSDWERMGMGDTPTLNHLEQGNLPQPCSTACPDDQPAREIMPLPPAESREDRQFRVRCPAVTRSVVNDGGPVPEATFTIGATSNQCGHWRRSRVQELSEEAPRRWPLATSKTPSNRRVLAAQGSRFWLPSLDAGVVPRGVALDRMADFAVRVYLDPTNPELFISSQNRQYAIAHGFGVIAQRDFPDSLYPVGSVGGRATWAVTTRTVLDVARFPASSEVPFIVATAPDGVTWATPTRAVERDGTLFVASGDTISVGDVRQQLTPLFASPAAMTRAIVPLPGLPVRALAARGRDGGTPELWSVTASGVHRSTSLDGTSWATTRLSLGPNDVLAFLPWSSGSAMRLLLSTGAVISLPTAVPLATPPVSGGRVISAERFCGTTWALVSAPDATTDLYVLTETPADGGLAGWRLAPRPITEGPLSTARLQVTSVDLLVLTEWGDVVSIKPNATGCSAD